MSGDGTNVPRRGGRKKKVTRGDRVRGCRGWGCLHRGSGADTGDRVGDCTEEGGAGEGGFA